MRAQRERADDFFLQQLGVDHFHRARKFQREFVERGAAENAAHAGNFFEFGLRETGLGEILQRLLAQAFFADQAEMNRGGQRVERFVGADVGGGLLAADVLFARGEREHESAIAGGVGGLSGEAAGHLADEFFARGDHADVRAAVTGRDAEGLAFHGDDVRFGGGRTMPSETASVMALTSSAPEACAVSASAGKSSRTPKKFGDCTTTAAAARERFRLSARRGRSGRTRCSRFLRFPGRDFSRRCAEPGDIRDARSARRERGGGW